MQCGCGNGLREWAAGIIGAVAHIVYRVIELESGASDPKNYAKKSIFKRAGIGCGNPVVGIGGIMAANDPTEIL